MREHRFRVSCRAAKRQLFQDIRQLIGAAKQRAFTTTFPHLEKLNTVRSQLSWLFLQLISQN